MLPFGLDSQLILITLVTARIGGFVITSPFPGQSLPDKAKITLVLALGVPPILRWLEGRLAGGDPEGNPLDELERRLRSDAELTAPDYPVPHFHMRGKSFVREEV